MTLFADDAFDIVEALASDETRDSLLIGINGLDCAGKTTFARELCQRLEAAGIGPRLLHVDDFNDFDRQAYLYKSFEEGEFTPELLDDYYSHSVNYSALREAIKQEKSKGGITVVEGVFLYRDGMGDMFDFKVFVEVDVSLGRARYAARKQEVGDTRPITVYEDIWVPAFERYCKDWNPKEQADQVV